MIPKQNLLLYDKSDILMDKTSQVARNPTRLDHAVSNSSNSETMVIYLYTMLYERHTRQSLTK